MTVLFFFRRTGNRRKAWYVSFKKKKRKSRIHIMGKIATNNSTNLLILVIFFTHYISSNENAKRNTEIIKNRSTPWKESLDPSSSKAKSKSQLLFIKSNTRKRGGQDDSRIEKSVNARVGRKICPEGNRKTSKVGVYSFLPSLLVHKLKPPSKGRIEEEEGGRRRKGDAAAEAWNDFVGNNNRGRERWTHNGRRSRTIIDRGVHAAGQPTTDWLTDLFVLWHYRGNPISGARTEFEAASRPEGQRDAHAVDLHRLIWRFNLLSMSTAFQWGRPSISNCETRDSVLLWPRNADRMWKYGVFIYRYFYGALFLLSLGLRSKLLLGRGRIEWAISSICRCLMEDL